MDLRWRRCHRYSNSRVWIARIQQTADQFQICRRFPYWSGAWCSYVSDRIYLRRLTLNPLQSAYRTGHSTETAIIKIVDDFYAGINNKELTLWCLWIYRRHSTPSVARSYFIDSWIDSYVSNRQQFVKMGQYSASTIYCTSGVQQGSVLGPLFFAAYVSLIADVIYNFQSWNVVSSTR